MLVTGIGQCSWDYLAVIDSYPDADTKKEITVWEEQGGGPVATALIALSRLGVRCRFYGITGSDPEGEKIRESLISEGIDISGLKKRDNASSQKAFIAIEGGSGKRTIFWKRPSGEELRPKELGGDFLKGAGFLLLDGLMKEVSLFAAEKAYSMGIPSMLDAGKMRDGMIDIARLCNYVVASEEFARGIGWDGNPEVLGRDINNLGFKVTTVTLGSMGSISFINEDIIHVPAFPVDVVDTTGAGDVFHGGYIYGLLRGWDIRDTVRFASAMAALKCRAVGGRTAIPSLTEVMEFLEEKIGSI